MMNKRKIAVFVLVCALIGSMAALISMFKARQKQGHPGLKLVERPTLDSQGKVVRPVSVGLPEKVLDYVSTNLPIEDIELRFLPKDTTYGRRGYLKDDGFRTDMTAVLMGVDRTSIHKPQICLTGQGWKIEKSELVSIPVKRPHSYDLPAMKMTAAKVVKLRNGQWADIRAVYVYWFVSEKRLTAQHKERMWGTVEDLVKTGVLPRWAYVSCLSWCQPGQEEAAYRRMEQLIAEAVPEFQLTTLPTAAKAPRITAAMQ